MSEVAGRVKQASSSDVASSGFGVRREARMWQEARYMPCSIQRAKSEKNQWAKLVVVPDTLKRQHRDISIRIRQMRKPIERFMI